MLALTTQQVPGQSRLHETCLKKSNYINQNLKSSKLEKPQNPEHMRSQPTLKGSSLFLDPGLAGKLFSQLRLGARSF